MRVLRVVNSAAFGLQQKVLSIRQACAMIGTRGLRSVALSLLVSDMAPVGRDGATVLAHVLRRAAAGGMVAARCGVSTDEGFLVGLLLEIGILAELRHDPRAGAVVRMPAAERVDFERASGMCAHTDSGAELVRSFELPVAIADAVAGHHDASPRAGGLARVAWAAERIAAAWEGGDLEEAVAVARGSLCTVGFERSDAELVLERVPAVVADAAAAFGLVMETPQQLESLRQDATRALVELNAGYVLEIRRLEALIEARDTLAAERARAPVTHAGALHHPKDSRILPT